MINKEVKLIEASFVKRSTIPTGSLMYRVNKKNGRLRICIDFIELSKVCPKGQLFFIAHRYDS